MVEIENIVLDIYGVIISEGHNIRNILFPILPQHKQHSYCRKIYHDYALSKIDQKKFWKLMGVGKKFTVLEKKFYLRHYLDKDFYRVVRLFRKQNKNLFILSNIPREWSKYLEKRFKFQKYFLGKVYSWQYYAKKPDLKIYRELIKKYKLNPSRTLFIDDKIENIRAAKKINFKTCWYNRDNTNIKPISADLVISNLKQLIDKL